MNASRMNVAVLGLGFMGSTHVKAWRSVPGARLAAVMSSSETKLAGDLTSIEGNLGSTGEMMDFNGVRKYRSLDAVLADPDVDAVDVCLPTDEHARVAIASLRAGRHVLVEKPLALDFAGAGEVIAEAERSARMLMAGQVLRFVPAYRLLGRALQTAGPVRSASFRRRCAAPSWSRWLSDPARSGGGVFDLLIHDADYCISLWGLPARVRATGYEDMASGIDVIHAELIYPGMGPVILTGGWHHPKSYPFSMEFTVVAENSTFEWSSVAGDFRQYSRDGSASRQELASDDPFAAELAYFTECVREGKKPDFCPPAQSAQAVALMRFLLSSRGRPREEIQGKEIECKEIPCSL
jgi:predicted dehydrogenase